MAVLPDGEESSGPWWVGPSIIHKKLGLIEIKTSV